MRSFAKIFIVIAILVVALYATQQTKEFSTSAYFPTVGSSGSSDQTTDQISPRASFRRKKYASEPIFVSGTSVRVRKGPGTTYQQIASFKRGQELVFTGEVDGLWKKIRGAGVSGWMHGDYLSTVRPQQKKKVVVQKAQTASDDELRQRIINGSIAAYGGSCPCPYNYDRAGRKCGKRSAWSRPGGASPICYASDVTPAMLRRWHN